jgi:hypothetical protein
MTTRDRITEVTVGAVQEAVIPAAVIRAVGTPEEAEAVVADPVEKATTTGRKCMS